jgi:hypothetical protein
VRRIVSEAQRTLMAKAARRKDGYRGVPQSVAAAFIADDKGRKLPKHVKAKGRRR